MIFTFHSGYILIYSVPKDVELNPDFTFHSGYILMESDTD